MLIAVAVVCAVIAAAWWNREDTTSVSVPAPTVPSAAPAPPPPGRMVLDQDSGPLGARLTVRLTDWAPGSLLVRLCGNGAARGSVDCANGAAVTTYVTGAGSAAVVLTISAPPVACPCVVQATDLTTASRAAEPFQPVGLPELPAAPSAVAAQAAALEVVRARLAEPGGWRERWPAWFGGSGWRTLELTVRNPGGVPLVGGTVAVTVGRDDPPTTLVATPDIGALAPGEERTFHLRVTFGAPAYGTYRIQGELPDGTRVFLERTETVPWGLVGIAALFAGWLLSPLRRRTRRRRIADNPVGVTQ